jgi:hypothetical protein
MSGKFTVTIIDFPPVAPKHADRVRLGVVNELKLVIKDVPVHNTGESDRWLRSKVITHDHHPMNVVS